MLRSSSQAKHSKKPPLSIIADNNSPTRKSLQPTPKTKQSSTPQTASATPKNYFVSPKKSIAQQKLKYTLVEPNKTVNFEDQKTPKRGQLSQTMMSKSKKSEGAVSSSSTAGGGSVYRREVVNDYLVNEKNKQIEYWKNKALELEERNQELSSIQGRADALAEENRRLMSLLMEEVQQKTRWQERYNTLVSRFSRFKLDSTDNRGSLDIGGGAMQRSKSGSCLQTRNSLNDLFKSRIAQSKQRMGSFDLLNADGMYQNLQEKIRGATPDDLKQSEYKSIQPVNRNSTPDSEVRLTSIQEGEGSQNRFSLTHSEVEAVSKIDELRENSRDVTTEIKHSEYQQDRIETEPYAPRNYDLTIPRDNKENGGVMGTPDKMSLRDESKLHKRSVSDTKHCYGKGRNKLQFSLEISKIKQVLMSDKEALSNIQVNRKVCEGKPPKGKRSGSSSKD